MGVLDSLDALDAPSTAVPADELRQVKTLLWDIVRVNVAPAEVDEVKRALGTAAVDDNAQLMEEASALATIVGEVRRDVDDGAVARRLYENPARALVEGELRLLVKSIRRTASGDLAEGLGTAAVGASEIARRARQETEEPEREINWADIGGGGVDDPTRVVDPPKPPPRGAGGGFPPRRRVGAPRWTRGRRSCSSPPAKERAMLEYVVGGADALSIRAGDAADAAVSTGVAVPLLAPPHRARAATRAARARRRATGARASSRTRRRRGGAGRRGPRHDLRRRRRRRAAAGASHRGARRVARRRGVSAAVLRRGGGDRRGACGRRRRT